MSEAITGRGAKVERPLSPHLQVYKLTISMLMSGLHRITGMALYLGTLLLAVWFMAAAAGPDQFDTVSTLLASWPGKLVLVGYTWALIHHALGGIRHFIWDFGVGYDLQTVDRLSWGSIIASVLLTGAVWIMALKATGGI